MRLEERCVFKYVFQKCVSNERLERWAVSVGRVSVGSRESVASQSLVGRRRTTRRSLWVTLLRFALSHAFELPPRLKIVDRTIEEAWLCSTSSKRGQRREAQHCGWSRTRSWWFWENGSRPAAAAPVSPAGLLQQKEEAVVAVQLAETSSSLELTSALCWSRRWGRRWPRSSRRGTSGCTECRGASSKFSSCCV